jgi:hypothetical protein
MESLTSETELHPPPWWVRYSRSRVEAFDWITKALCESRVLSENRVWEERDLRPGLHTRG